ncbi:MAG: LysR substrate-binding domain-containing protein, partial [Alcanivoracaceae bacterium]
MKFSLRQLEVFLATAHAENVTRASDQLAMSQSAASSALKELERTLDQPLFDRVGKRLQLNDTGRWLLPRAEALLAEARELEQELSGQPGSGDLRLGATLTIGNYLAVTLVSDYKRQHPGAQVSLDVENTRAIADKLRQFQLDIGLIEGEVQDPMLHITPWRDDELVVFSAPDHPLAQQGAALDDHQLAAARWILRETGSGTRQTFDRAMAGLLSALHVELELQHTEAIKRTVEAGLGIGCLSRETLREAFSRGTLVPLDVPHRDFSRRFYVVTHT